MLRKLLFSALAVALFATAETAQAQTTATPVAGTAATAQLPARQAYRKAAKAQRVLSKREKQAVAAQARAEQARRDAEAATAQARATGQGWSDEPLPASTTGYNPATNRPNMNVSVAPGMPLNQISSGVTTDYDGRPIRRAEQPATTLPTAR